jgi:hypothetical protein
MIMARASRPRGRLWVWSGILSSSTSPSGQYLSTRQLPLSSTEPSPILDISIVFSSLSVTSISPQSPKRQPMQYRMVLLYSSSHHPIFPFQIPHLFSLPLLMLRVQRANNINMSLPTLATFSPHALHSISLYPPIPSLPIPRRKRTLQPSHNFFTELLTFIPRTCSCIPFVDDGIK